MKKALLLIVVIGITVFSLSPVSAREPDKHHVNIMRAGYNCVMPVDDSVPGTYQASAADTYNIVRYDFEPGSWQGWTSRDMHAQIDTFFHVDDFSGLGGGDFGYYAALEGAKSMWCGSRTGGGSYLCGWDSAPGYGNNWDQLLTSDSISFSGTLELGFKGLVHCENPPYDKLTVEYEDEGSWVILATYGGYQELDTSFQVDSATVGGSTRFRFHFVSDGAWSDEDGLYNTDGAAIIDSITVKDSGTYYNYEDFESASAGDRSSGIWHGEASPGFGNYAAIRSGLIAVGTDPCTSNLSSQLVFFDGSTEPADQQVYPGLPITPRCLNGGGTEAPCQSEIAISPYIDLNRHSTGNNEVQDAVIPEGERYHLGGVLLYYTTYLDLPLDNLVFYNWQARSIEDGCPGPWQAPDMIYYYDTGYNFEMYDLSGYIGSPNDTIQVGFAVIDMCDVWGGYYGTCANHTPAPWFDNVKIKRHSQLGPSWRYGWQCRLFQDTFPFQSSTSGDTCRADAALDIAPDDDEHRIDRGDSIVVEVTSPIAGGLGTDPAYGGAAVYIHVKAEDPADATSLAGPQLVGADDGWMKYISDDGTWTKLRGDTARTGDPGSRSAAHDYYMFDLNDSLFTRGYIIEYYFSAVDLDGVSGTLPLNAGQGGCFEFSCLPLDDEVDVLFVDDYHGRGSWNGLVHDYWEPAFQAVITSGVPDRYDINAPTSSLGNGLESCIDAAALGQYYHTIIWDSGDLSSGTLSTGSTEKTNDAQLLEDWFTDIHGHNHRTNLLVMGERLVSDLYYQGATSFQANVLGCELDRYNYFDCTGGIMGGGIVYPTLEPVSGGCMDGLDSFCLDGGCPYINKFDMLALVGANSSYALKYSAGCESETKYAAVASNDTTLSGRPARAVTCAFSMMQVRDCEDNGPPARNEFFARVMEFFENGVNPDITEDDPEPERLVTRLHQNYPNPFNPSTVIRFGLSSRRRVTVRIFDVRGRLVETLLDQVRGPGIYDDVRWDGTNAAGEKVASGVYFYRMRAGSYSAMKKMVLLR